MRKVLAVLLAMVLVCGLFAALGAVSVAADGFIYVAGTEYDVSTNMITATNDVTQGNINLKTMYVADLGPEDRGWTVYNWISASFDGTQGGMQTGDGVRIQLVHPLSVQQFPSFVMRLMFNCGGTFYAFNQNTTNFCPRNAAQQFQLGGSSAPITFDSARFADADGFVRGIIFQLKSDDIRAQFFIDSITPLATTYTPAAVTPINANIYGGVVSGNANGFNLAFEDKEAFSTVPVGSAFKSSNNLYINGIYSNDATATVSTDHTLHIACQANEGDVVSLDGTFGPEYVGPISVRYQNGKWTNVLCGNQTEPYIFETLLNNPSFDTSVSRWQLNGKPATCQDTIQLTENGYDGNGLLLNHFSGGAASYSVRTTGNFTVTPGVSYWVRAKVRATGNVKLGCSFYSNTTAGICDKVDNTTVLKSGNTEWEQINWLLTVPLGTASIKLQLEQTFANTAATVIYDEVALYRLFDDGDINGDTDTDVRDLVRFKKYFADSENISLSSLNTADVNRNGIINALDMIALKRVLVDLSATDTAGLAPKVAVNSPNGVVYPYLDICKKFITTPGALIGTTNAAGNRIYYSAVEDSCKPITVSWETVSENYADFTVEYATKPDFSNATALTTTQKSVDLYNLYKGTAYYVRVTAHGNDGEDYVGESTFETTDQGPRVMKIDGLYNVRDLGGYVTPNGTTLQGKIFRGSEMNGSHNIALTPAGDDYMSNVLGIKTDLDLRNPADSGYTYTSPISSANLQYVSIGNYTAAFTQKELFRQIFSMMSYEANYPFYVHCWGGADRTGTVCFLVNALLGVEEETLVKDYEYTSYSIFGIRDSRGTEYAFAEFLDQLKSYPGTTLADKTENYMKDIGLTEDEIYNIRAIMLGQPTRVSVEAPATLDMDQDENYFIAVGGGAQVAAVSIDGQPVNFADGENGISIARADLPELTAGDTVNGTLTLDDGTEYPFTFKCVSSKVPELTEYMFSKTGTVTLNNQVKTVQSDLPVGYGKTVRMHLRSVTGTNGNLQVFIGSYGICLRGGCFRVWALGQNGVYTEIGRNGESMNAASQLFDNGGDLLLRVDCEPGGVTLSWSVEIGGVTKCTYAYTVGSVSETGYRGRRIDDEIPSANAKVTVKIDGETAGTPELTVTTGVGTTPPVQKDYVDFADYISAETGILTLDSNHKTVSSNTPIGYNQKVRIDMQSTTVANGRIYVTIGSYGVLLRGGAFRIIARNANGSYAEKSTLYAQAGYPFNCPVNYFDTAGRYLMLEVDEKSDGMYIVAAAYNAGGVAEWTCSYKIGTFSDDTGRVANEITSQNAYLTVEIDGTDSGTKSLAIKATGGTDVPEEPGTPEEPEKPEIKNVNLTDYLKTATGSVTLNSTNKMVQSNVIGYNRKVRIDLKTNTDTNGNLWILLGSYGVHLRGGSFRIAKMNIAGSFDELTRVGETLNCATQIFDDGAHYMVLGVLEDSKDITVTVTVYTAAGAVVCDYTYVIGSYQGAVMPDGGRISGEISSENARLTVIADNASLGTVSATVQTGKTE